jgi:hypothetical protein
MEAGTAGPRTTTPRSNGVRAGLSRYTTETKAAFKTTELIVYVVASALVLIAAMILDESDAGGFGAKQAWLYFTILSAGYMISRGLAKSGSRDPYTDDNDSGHDRR